MNIKIISWLALAIAVVALALSITQMVTNGSTVASGSQFRFKSNDEPLGDCFSNGQKIASGVTEAVCNTRGGVFIGGINIGK